MEGEAALEVEHLSVRFGSTEVIGDVSFALPKGAALAVIGPNGAGKTVLFRALVGAIPHAGLLRWRQGTRLGYVPQKLDLERDLPVSGLDLLRARAGVAKASPAQVDAALAATGFARERAARPIGAFSGGELQLLLVAFALIAEPTVLLLDEPTAGLDQPGQERLYDLLARLRAEHETTVLLISHELSVVARQATHVLCLSRTRAWFGPPREIVTPETLEQVYGMPLSFHVHDDA